MLSVSGKRCRKNGEYISECLHKIVRRFKKGDTFPYCEEGCGEVVWSLW